MLIPTNYWLGEKTLDLEYPWLTPEAIMFLEHNLKNTYSVLEFGSGGSTLFFARRCKKVISYDTERNWLEAVRTEIKNKMLENIELNFFEKISDIKLPTEYFDVINVDCEPNKINRIDVMLMFAPYLKTNGYLVLDNYGYYDKTDVLFSNIDIFTFDDVHWCGKGTRIFLKKGQMNSFTSKTLKLFFPHNKLLDNHIAYIDIPEDAGNFKKQALEHNIEILDNIDLEIVIENNVKTDFIVSFWGAGFEMPKLTHKQVAQKFKEKNIKSLVFWDDIHWWTIDNFKHLFQFFSLADKLLLPYYDRFLKYKEYELYHSKAVEFNWWVSDKIKSINIDWNKRKDKILLWGNLSKDIYPFRNKIFEGNKSIIEILNHSGYDSQLKKHEFYNRKILNYLNNFKGSIGTNAQKVTLNGFTHQLDYILHKNFEITGCTLAYLEDSESLQMLGFKPWKNFIPISIEETIDSLQEKFNFLYKDEGKKIFEAGKEFMLEQHCSTNRILQLFNIIKKYE